MNTDNTMWLVAMQLWGSESRFEVFELESDAREFADRYNLPAIKVLIVRVPVHRAS